MCKASIDRLAVIPVNITSNLREHNSMVRQPRFHLARRKAAFAINSAGPWTRLPPHIAEAPTVSSFKDRLDANWCSIFPDIA